ncbi:hypothetical protein [Amycolatopsis magusensis]|uniref:hypothetical protein n=1 Tax=Amycolatopsis magusensis TaxID=882444 RepID=UPI0024A92D3A|nr:hypothetical protein [Amycolatopsis magusensis]MDI5979385.1 hypothetical protein [Amycolatopsis magusensis]
MIPVFPYSTIFGDIGFEVTSVSVDGTPLPYSRVSKMEHTVALHQSGREHWDLVTLRLSATLPAQELADGQWQDVHCLAVLTEKSTNVRTTARLQAGAGGTWHGSIELARTNHSTRATLSLMVVGTVDGVPGRLIGRPARDWYVDLKSSTPVRQREIDIVEVDFRDGPEVALRPFKDAPWIIDTAGEIPTVFLNTAAIEGFIELLYGTGGSVGEKVLRETVQSQIAQEAWTAMFQAAISDLDLDEDGTPQMPGGWRGSVLTVMLPDVFPDLTPTDALYEINQRRAEGFSWSELQTLMQYAAGKRSQVAKRVTAAVRSVHRGGSGDR